MARTRVKRNIYGNLIGYRGRAKEINFGDDPVEAAVWAVKNNATTDDIDVEECIREALKGKYDD